MEEVVGEIDIFTSATGNFNIITLEHMKKMKNNAIVGSIGHVDNEIDMAGLEDPKNGCKVENIKPQVDRFVIRDVLLFHQPGPGTDRPQPQLHHHQGIQERCLL